jgi:hypothetical protein
MATDGMNIDTDITLYTIEDILSIFNIVDPTSANVTDVANSLIAQMTREGKPDLVTFFGEARDKVLDYLENLNKDSSDNMVEQLWNMESATATPVNYFDDGSHMSAPTILKLPAAAGGSTALVLARHILNIDSQYRSNILPYVDNPLANSFNTQFLFNLTTPINRAVSMRLYSYQIPTSWYAFNAQSGNTFFMYNGIIIIIPDGNYSATSLVNSINAQAALNVATQSLTVTYNSTTNRIAFTNNDILSASVEIIFFIQSNVVNFANCGAFVVSNFQTLGINKTLGWAMGFRTPADATTGDVVLTLQPGAANTITADVSIDTYGPKYFVLSVEEFSNHRLTSGMYNITNSKSRAKISIPDFYKTIRVACKLREGVLTQAEQYTINAITTDSTPNNIRSGFNNTLPGPSAPSALAVIPLVNITNLRPDPYIKFGADLVDCFRNYSSPTVLNRLIVRLTDDKGNLVNLYDNDWSFSLIVEERLN